VQPISRPLREKPVLKKHQKIQHVIKEHYFAPVSSFIILFFSFIIYQNLLIAGWISPIIGGGFTVGTLGCLPFLIIAYIRHFTHYRIISSIEILYVIFLLIFLVNIILNTKPHDNNDIIFSHAASLSHLITTYLLARLLPVENVKRVRLLVTVSLFFTIGITLLNTFNLVKAEVDYESYQLNYHAMGFAILVQSIYTIPCLGFINRALAFCLLLIVFLVIGSRAELIGFIILAFLIEFFKNRVNRLDFIAIIIPFFLLAFTGFFYIIQINFPNNRIFLLLHLTKDESFIERSMLNKNALSTIQSNPFLGKYASYEPGQYAHNILSTWVDLGLFGFLILLSIFFISFFYLIIYYRQCQSDLVYIMSVISMLVVFVLLITSKTYLYPLIGIAVGLFGRQYSKSRQFTITVQKPRRPQIRGV
jgi:hypothetical protein